MNRHKRLTTEIEELRQNLYKAASAAETYTSAEVINLSKKLDTKLNELTGYIQQSSTGQTS
ncbi:aspartyl-phosphate phosphatase Spo0E family protein [Bacillus marinisedimentorum]|uniref:aspartyl-phosphate phosphatase Spo0E family protein n=1 Tax=Bacillus marinisedimentorum TaxID=1821260 RepID=UPI0007DFECB4|nr:aspartyl-phosphate phosphatase Spo0E family protein [Bacillus marinisedimentorum]